MKRIINKLNKMNVTNYAIEGKEIKVYDDATAAIICKELKIGGYKTAADVWYLSKGYTSNELILNNID